MSNWRDGSQEYWIGVAEGRESALVPLRDLEWMGAPDLGEPTCPACCAQKREGHRFDCPIASVLYPHTPRRRRGPSCARCHGDGFPTCRCRVEEEDAPVRACPGCSSVFGLTEAHDCPTHSFGGRPRCAKCSKPEQHVNHYDGGHLFEGA